MTEHEIATGSDAFSIVVNHYGNARGTKSEFEKSNPDLLDPLINANLATYHLASDALSPGLSSIRAALEECWTGSSADNALSIVDQLETNSSTIGTNTLACYDSFVHFQATWRSCKGDAGSLYEGVAGTGAGEDNSGARRVYLRFNDAMQTSMHAMPSELVYREPLSPGRHAPGAGGTGAGGAGGAGGSGGPGATPRGGDAFVPASFTTPGAGSTNHGVPASGTGGVYHGGNGGYGTTPGNGSGTGTGSGTGSGIDTTPTLANYPGGTLPGGFGTGGVGAGGLGTGGLGAGGLGAGGLGAGGVGTGGAANAGMIIPGGFGGGLGGNAALAGADETGNAELTGSGSAFDVADEQAGDGVLGAQEGIGGVGSDNAASARPMLGGRGAGGGSDDEDERDRTTWLAEDDGIWESGAVAPPGTIG